jgi:hypothetical protein
MSEVDTEHLEEVPMQPASVVDSNISVDWTPENEKIVVEWCDIAKCYKWLHTRAHQSYSHMHAWFTIPAIILSTISGTASFAQGSLPLSMQLYAPMVIGSVNIFIGILTTIQQYLKISEYNESHRVSAIAWDKFARNIRIELAKHPDDRAMDAGHFLKANREEYDRLMETSPSIPEYITAELIKTFSEYEDKWWDCCNTEKEKEKEEKKQRELKKKAEMFDKVKKPDVCNIIATTDDDRHPWYKDAANSVASVPRNEDVLYSVVSQKISKIQEEMAKKQSEIRNEYETRLQREKELREEEQENARRAEIQQRFVSSTVLIANKIKEQNKKIDEYVKLFENSRGRKPLSDEISEAMGAEIDEEILAKYIVNYSAMDSIV